MNKHELAFLLSRRTVLDKIRAFYGNRSRNVMECDRGGSEVTVSELDIPSLSDLDLRKEVAKAIDYHVEHGYWYHLMLGEEKVGHDARTEESAWEDLPDFDISYTFPLLLELDEMGYDVDLCVERVNTPERVMAVTAYSRTSSRHFVVESKSDTDPSDAIAKVYLMARRELGMLRIATAEVTK